MDLWLPARIDHLAIMHEKFWFQQIKSLPLDYTLVETDSASFIWTQKRCLITVVAEGWSRWRCDKQSSQTLSEQRKHWMKDINLSILTNTSPAGWEEKAPCWWLFDGWLIQYLSHLGFKRMLTEPKLSAKGFCETSCHRRRKHADAVYG